MGKKALKLIIVGIIITVGIISVPSFFHQDTSKEIKSSNHPQKEFLKGVLSYPTGTYVGQKERITISANGDIMFHSPQISSAYKDGAYHFDDTFAHVKKYIKKADLALGNFEATTGGGQPNGYPVFNAPDETLETLADVGYDILSTANNHTLDTGKKGVLRTIEKIKENGMVNIGTYTKPGEHIYIAEAKGIKVAVLAYTYGLNGMDNLLSNDEREYMVNKISKAKIKSDIKKAKEKGADFTIVFIHWGSEYQLNPSKDQQDLASEMFEWGTDIILGSHPHVIQKSEMVEVDGEMKYVIYSMGNFISNQRRETLGSISEREYTEDGVMVNLTLEKDFLLNKSKIISVNHTPTWVNRTGNSGTYKYEILPVKEALNSKIDSTTKSKLKKSYENTMGKMSTYRNLGEN